MLTPKPSQVVTRLALAQALYETEARNDDDPPTWAEQAYKGWYLERATVILEKLDAAAPRRKVGGRV